MQTDHVLSVKQKININNYSKQSLTLQTVINVTANQASGKLQMVSLTVESIDTAQSNACNGVQTWGGVDRQRERVLPYRVTEPPQNAASPLVRMILAILALPLQSPHNTRPGVDSKQLKLSDLRRYRQQTGTT